MSRVWVATHRGRSVHRGGVLYLTGGVEPDWELG